GGGGRRLGAGLVDRDVGGVHGGGDLEVGGDAVEASAGDRQAELGEQRRQVGRRLGVPPGQRQVDGGRGEPVGDRGEAPVAQARDHVVEAGRRVGDDEQHGEV